MECLKKINEALKKDGPIKIVIEKNLKGTITLEISEKSLIGFDNDKGIQDLFNQSR